MGNNYYGYGSERSWVTSIIQEYRSSQNPSIFIRKIGDKGEYSNYQELEVQNKKEQQDLTNYYIENYKEIGFFKSLFTDTLELIKLKDANKKILASFNKNTESLQMELKIARVFFDIDVTGDILSDIRWYNTANLLTESRKNPNYYNELNKIISGDYKKNRDVTNINKGIEFENKIYQVLGKYGFGNIEMKSKLESTETYKGDGGIDIVAIDHFGRKVAIQCKNTKQVSNDIISRTHGAKDLSLYKCNYAMVITSGKFTVPARIEARDLNVVLWDGDDLIKFEKDFYNNSLDINDFYKKKY